MTAFSQENNPYSSWITFYSSEEFKESVIKVVEVFEELANVASDVQKEKKIKPTFRSFRCFGYRIITHGRHPHEVGIQVFGCEKKRKYWIPAREDDGRGDVRYI